MMRTIGYFLIGALWVAICGSVIFFVGGLRVGQPVALELAIWCAPLATIFGIWSMAYFSDQAKQKQ